VQHALEVQRLQVTRLVVRCIGVGDVLRQHLLALVQPVHPRRQHPEQAEVLQIHRVTATGPAGALVVLSGRAETVMLDLTSA
jgi:hypothetical protein